MFTLAVLGKFPLVNSPRWIFPDKIPPGKLPPANYHLAKVPPGEFPPIKFPNPNPNSTPNPNPDSVLNSPGREQFTRGGIWPGGNSPGGNLPGGIWSGRIHWGGNWPGGNFPDSYFSTFFFNCWNLFLIELIFKLPIVTLFVFLIRISFILLQEFGVVLMGFFQSIIPFLYLKYFV